MLKIRLIAKIEIKDHQVVKGIRYEGLRVLGSPEYFSKQYYLDGIDEIIYHDVLASLLGRNVINEFVKNTAKEINIPLTVSGGIRSINDIYNLLKNGADRVAINSSAYKNPKILKEAVKEFGSSTIISNLDIGLINNKYFLFTENGKNRNDKKINDWIKQVEDFGVSEFAINTIHKDGTLDGFDKNLVDFLDKKINISYVFGGGINKLEDILKLSKYKNIRGITLSSLLHYNYLNQKYINDNENFFFLETANKKKFEKINIKKIKKFLIKNKISCRN